jgi:hypothetical protein
VTARPLTQLVPPSLLQGRWIVVLVCYLDDSGKDSQNAVTTLAGYVGRDAEWEAFERDVEPWFAEYRVGVLHAKDLHSGRGDFKDWKVAKKLGFVSRICLARNPRAMLGISRSAKKETYQEHKADRGRQATSSPYAFCFNLIIDRILRSVVSGKAANEEGVTFTVEAGNEHNNEIELAFNEIRSKHGLNDQLRSICFVPKDHSRAIQLADLFAFYARRNDLAQLRARDAGQETHSVDTIMKVIAEGLPHDGYVATAFGDRAGGSRFLAGDL